MSASSNFWYVPVASSDEPASTAIKKFEEEGADLVSYIQI